jgi:hypothetical protein
MKLYSLYNKRLQKLLNHPKVGLWYTPDLSEAEDMLRVCQEYADTLHVDGYRDDFVLVDSITGEEIKCQHLSEAD